MNQNWHEKAEIQQKERKLQWSRVSALVGHG